MMLSAQTKSTWDKEGNMTMDTQNVLEKVNREQPCTDPFGTRAGVRQAEWAGSSSKANSRSWFFTQLTAKLCVSLPRPPQHPGVKVTQGKQPTAMKNKQRRRITAHLSPLGSPGDAGHGGLQGTDGNRQFVSAHSSPPDPLTRAPIPAP